MGGRPVDADVIVVGGGPAGSAAAISCAARGLRVRLYEREPQERHRPGETLHPGVEPLLGQLGVADRLAQVTGARHCGTWIETDGVRRFEAFGGDAAAPWRGFQVWRADFDALLLERARALGVDVRLGCAPTGLLANGNDVGGVRTKDGDVASHVVVDATGAARWLARALDIDSTPRSPQLIARYGYVEGSCPARDDAPLLVSNALGWTWTARVRPGVYQWTRVRLGSAATAGDGPPEELRNLAALGPVRGADVTWRIASRTAGPGWFMVGDAAATLDPTSSHGVLKGLMSGMMAGHLTAAGLTGKAPRAALPQAYHQWLADWFETDAIQLRTFYREAGAPGF
ncbi:tryptophan 7-halogenase [Ancylobacter sp. Lp-2]|uniref:NAD(P)/FAD-dependent oxidoreductase n=1 Tax=Ancylobacter sp. Lp-2 TaxID=2881339 RepID=UPI001E483636|nr:tryptophan 7-halogenase [Ancylobacter sp. Lp-2]MCB4767728.1 tryptophan 7-halogenase [Ancylobacter sp. Lp-2]